MGLRYIKTDKNGTKYYEDDTCPRCGGRGYIECYKYVEAGMCFLCQGRGFWKLRTFKEYTPEYQAILDERRIARRAKKAAEFNAHIADYYKALGLAENGHAFIVLATTKGLADELKASGAKFNGSWWYFDHSEEKWKTAEIDAVKLLDIRPEENYCKWDKDRSDFEWECKYIYSKLLSELREKENESVVTEYYGNIGDKVQKEVTITGIFSFEVTDNYSYEHDTMTMWGYKMQDDENHVFVWMTSSKSHYDLCTQITGKPYYEIDENGIEQYYYNNPTKMRETIIGAKAVLKGRVKSFKERDGLKETVLTRCSFKFAA